STGDAAASARPGLGWKPPAGARTVAAVGRGETRGAGAAGPRRSQPTPFGGVSAVPPLGARWTSSITNGATLTLVDGGVGSASRHAFQTATDGGVKDLNGYLMERLTPAPKRLRCELDFQGPLPAGIGELDILTFDATTGGKEHRRYIGYLEDGWAIAEYQQGAINRSAKVAGMPAGRWTPLVLDTDGLRLTLPVDGMNVTNLDTLTVPAGAES